MWEKLPPIFVYPTPGHNFSLFDHAFDDVVQMVVVLYGLYQVNESNHGGPVFYGWSISGRRLKLNALVKALK